MIATADQLEQDAQAPQSHPLDHPLDRRCPITGELLPSSLDEALILRPLRIKACAQSEAKQVREMELCAASPLYWINWWVWTFNVKAIDPSGREKPAQSQHVPFITWPVQDRSILDTVECIEAGEDVISDKSRDMGESWKYVAIADWHWLFKDNSTPLLVSRIEDLVDKAGDPDCLFWKIDYINRWLPAWMLPGPSEWFQRDGRCRNHLHLENPENGASIDGQATTGHVGRGGRRTFVLFDEMASIQQARAAWQSAADTTACRIGNSTPIGPGTEFTKQRNNGIRTGRPRVLTVGYWDHPHKGRGREWRTDDDGSMTGISGRGYWWTPWFQNEVERRQDPQDIGQNILIDHVTSGRGVFSTVIVTRHLQQHGRDPVRCEIDGDRFVEDDNGRWYVWCDLDGSGRVKGGDRTNFVGFADPSYGIGAANAAVAFMDRETGVVAAEYVDPHTTPADLAIEMTVAGRHIFGGQTGYAFLGWETNGPGESLFIDFNRLAYPFVYCQRATDTAREERTKRYGWTSDRRRKRILCSALGRALTRSQVTICSKPGLGEMLDYVYFDDGSIGPGHLADEMTGAREAHGDRVIAYAGCVLMRAEAPSYEEAAFEFKRGTLGEIAGHGSRMSTKEPQTKDPFRRKGR